MMGILYMAFGALLVVSGVLAAALADRIRGIRAQRTPVTPRERAETVRPAPAPTPARRVPIPVTPATDDMNDVIAALVAAGYKKPVAAAAALGCTGQERASLESWTRAALRRCAQA